MAAASVASRSRGKHMNGSVDDVAHTGGASIVPRTLTVHATGMSVDKRTPVFGSSQHGALPVLASPGSAYTSHTCRLALSAMAVGTMRSALRRRRSATSESRRKSTSDGSVLRWHPARMQSRRWSPGTNVTSRTTNVYSRRSILSNPASSAVVLAHSSVVGHTNTPRTPASTTGGTTDSERKCMNSPSSRHSSAARSFTGVSIHSSYALSANASTVSSGASSGANAGPRGGPA
mmetsp:Transcript_26812/g.65227  ORF Transcript_26812/g.65227 Transcript_26812/m.65227 type:complete len:233 (+) Transcript_26812:364-1062(+)